LFITGDIQNDDINLAVSNSSTIRWELSKRADSMIQAGFITGFQYLIIDGEKEEMYNSSVISTLFTFSNLTVGHKYTVYGIVLTTDISSGPLEYGPRTLLPHG